jgi:hypothetical protein
MALFRKPVKWFFPLMAAFLLISASAPGAEPPAKPVAQDSLKKRIEREQAFLLRAVEELDKSLTYVMETMAILEDGPGAADALEPKRLTSDAAEFLDWYQTHTGWLGGMAAEFQADLAASYSREGAGTAWTARYEEIAKGYQKLAGQLGGKIRELDAALGKIEARILKLKQAVQERRLLVEKDDLELAKELWPSYRDWPYGSREAVYKDLTEEEVGRFRYELTALGEQQKQLEVLAELGKYELIWISLKVGDSVALEAVARAIGDGADGPLRNACRDAVRTYESDVASLGRAADEIDRKLAGITPTGTMKMLDLFEVLSRHYRKMKDRYERHIEWLKGQMGGYRADLVELGRGN